MSTSKPPETPEVRGIWFAAQVTAIWSGCGFALASTVAPDAVNMGLGVGIFAVLLTIFALYLMFNPED